MKPRSAWLLAVLVLVGALAWFVRDVEGLRYPFVSDARLPAAEVPVEAEWFSRDPDGLYHTRRIARVLDEGLPVAETDPRLAFPEGAAIPWPPYYDLACALLLKPFVPAHAEHAASRADSTPRRAWLERTVATLPAIFGLLTTLLAAGAAGALARERSGATTRSLLAAALVGGITYALCRSAVNYSLVGSGDHHAWVSLLNATLLMLACGALGKRALASRGRGALMGVAAGLVAGVMLGSWVAALLYVLQLQLVLGWMLVRRAREDQPGLAAFGLAFHLAAALAVLPAVISSPWRQEFPWLVVNLSWFHPLLLGLGALVFTPPVLWGRTRLASGTPAARRYPLLVAAVLVVGALALWLTGAGPAAGIAEGFAWVSRVNAFMGTVQESAPLLGPRAGGTGAGDQLFLALGFGVVLLPLAWLALLRETLRERRDTWLPWLVVTPLLLVQALAQRRFGDALAFPMAVVLGYGAARAVSFGALSRGPAWGVLPALALVAVLLQWPSIEVTRGSLKAGESWDVGGPGDHILGERMLYEWLRRHTPPGEDYAVLAHWDRGHMLEWAADRASVATNFGSYVGEDSYRDPSRFYLEEDPVRARELLERRGVRFVLAPGSLPSNLESMVRATDPDLASRYMRFIPGRGNVTTRPWLATMGARLLADGFQATPPNVPAAGRSNPLNFLRLVHVSPWRDLRFPKPITGAPQPVGFVWEHVRGAGVAATGAPGEELRLEFRIEFARADYTTTWLATAVCDERGIARLWVPYSTEVPNGDAVIRAARWSVGDRSGTLVIPEAAVLGGKPIVLR